MFTNSMTLDQLIDWVRSVEPAETPEVEPAKSEMVVKEVVEEYACT